MTATRPIRCLGIVNRGEAAMRCLRAVKALRALEGGELRALVLYTAADRDAPFVRHADVAVALPMRANAAAAYLDHQVLLEGLRAGGADAVWPGWGFVAEDPDFAERVASAGLRFLGPAAAVMRRLGDKVAAKELAQSLGVPVIAWSGEVVADHAAALRHAGTLGYPVMIKAAAGGGGRGIRVAGAAADLPAALRAAAAEAAAAFGDGRVFLERCLTNGRHVEVQIAGDACSRVIALGCRDCSVQRRHQKVIEEAPPPGLAPAMLQALEQAAIALAAAAGYCGVGTVEFLVTPPQFFFLEMNPRLQVEHGITEAITGLDLVQLQIRIARGEPLPATTGASRGVAIEARVCAEDPDAGFLPAPGRVVRCDPPLGANIRVDSGVVAGSVVPPDFDSLVAKVIATGAARDQALARLSCALSDFELVIAGGATNKGYLLDVLAAPAYRAAAFDTGWLDRWTADRPAPAFAVEALVAAAVLLYQEARRVARLNFYADTTNVLPARVPPSVGQQIDLSCAGEPYRLQVFALGAWRYRVHLEGRVVTATLREESPHAARLQLGERTLRVLYDLTETHLRLEVEGRPHRFGRQSAGQVCAGTPALVIAVHVRPGERVAAGQLLGLLEAMKLEIGFQAPVAGVVNEICVRPGQQVAAGDVLLIIDPASAIPALKPGQRQCFPEQPDPLALFGVRGGGQCPGPPSFAALAQAEPAARRAAIAAQRDEIRRVLLGYDADPERGELLSALLAAPLPERLAPAVGDELAEIRHELVLFADLEQLFSRTPRPSVTGAHRPSNSARLRAYVRRMQAAGAGLSEGFLAQLRTALRHYGVSSLRPSDALERAVLRLFAAQRAPELRHRLVLGVVRRVMSLARAGISLRQDGKLAKALARIARLRELVPDALADAALEARYVIFEEPALAQQMAQPLQELERWLAAAPAGLSEAMLQQLADAPRALFERVSGWLDHPDDQRRAAALSALLYRLYRPSTPVSRSALVHGGMVVQRLQLADGRVVYGCTGGNIELLSQVTTSEPAAVHALEVFASCDLDRLPPAPAAERITVTVARPGAPLVHRSYVAAPAGLRERKDLHGLHPETAARIDLGRLAGFALERLESPEGIYAFHGRSRSVAGDERVFVLADVRGIIVGEREAKRHVAAFERAFDAATRTLRAALNSRDLQRRLHWNRIALFVAPEVTLDPQTVQRVARRLAPATRHLGLEKVVVRLQLLERMAAQPRAVEVVIADPTGSRMEISWRTPQRAPLQPASVYERKVAAARRRGLVYPYEIIRLLTGGESENGAAFVSPSDLPAGHFEEYDLDPTAPRPLAVEVAQRAYGRNTGSVVFGIITTPTDKIPEGMRRVIILSDPTAEMGALAAPECDRIVAAIDLAERLRLPVEWLPVSSGARIAMESGTENLDATARVVRRLVTFTQAGGAIHVVVQGTNVGAQSYFDALSTMLMHTRGVLIMTPAAAMVLTGRAALEAAGSVAAEDEVAIGGFERIMGPNGEAQYFAPNLADAYRLLYLHYRYTYVVPGEPGPRRWPTADSADRTITEAACEAQDGQDFRTVGEIFDDVANPGRKRPFPMRAVMRAVIDQDGGYLERWQAMAGAETAIVWDAHLGGAPVCLIGIESQNLPRDGYRPLDGPSSWNGGTLFPLSSKKVARAINAASGNRPVVLLANLSGFDGSPESLRKLQLEYGAEIARAVVNFRGPLLFVVVSRYHGGAYVVFSRALNDELHATALAGSYASVIGGAAAAVVVFPREVRARAAADPRVQTARTSGDDEYERVLAQVLLEKQAEVAAEFDAIHTVERARAVGSLAAIIPPAQLRPYLVRRLAGG
ncbi:MAG: biotin/lipoyl-binding protein [Deltaproteobacteria bacterium]|nr:biotin/lipoyl-binding protein [Deltaproteobacteria bacterium]